MVSMQILLSTGPFPAVDGNLLTRGLTSAAGETFGETATQTDPKTQSP